MSRRSDFPGGLRPERMPMIAGYVFIGAGCVMLIGGIVLVIQDPAGFALIAFGLVFMGAGHLARRLFAPPEGKRAVHVAAFEADIQNVNLTRGTRRQASVLYVDADATEEEVRAATDRWLREQWARRPDWVAGRIVAEDERTGGRLRLAAGVWSAFALGAAAAALAWGGIFRLIATVAALVAGALIVRAIRGRLHRRKYGTSILTLARTPAFLGDVLAGEVETGVPRDAAPHDGFRVRLRCVHRWEETRRRGPNDTRPSHHHRDVLWEAEQRAEGHATGGRAILSVPVELRLPADLPASTLAPSDEGITWELEITAEMEGLDYEARFDVPVLPQGAGGWGAT